MANQVTLKYESFLRAEIEFSDGSNVTIDAPATCGGSGEVNPSPKDIFAAGYGSCMIMLMDISAKKAGFGITGSKITVSPVWAQDKSQLAEVNTTVVLPSQLAEDQLDTLREGAYNCPIHKSLRPEVKTTLTFKVA
jgi:uncharacterized OsmC-like protein